MFNAKLPEGIVRIMCGYYAEAILHMEVGMGLTILLQQLRVVGVSDDLVPRPGASFEVTELIAKDPYFLSDHYL